MQSLALFHTTQIRTNAPGATTPHPLLHRRADLILLSLQTRTKRRGGTRVPSFLLLLGILAFAVTLALWLSASLSPVVASTHLTLSWPMYVEETHFNPLPSS